MSSLIVILGDQLNKNISSLKDCNKKDDLIMMCEVINECQSPKHHKKKIAFILSAMRHFALDLQEDGYRVCYIKLDDPSNSGSFISEILRISKKYNINQVKVTHPGEYRVLEDLNSIKSIDLEVLEDDRFLCSIQDFKDFAKKRNKLVMEYFYRSMRLKYNILMDGGNPEGGKWNYDSENRKSIKPGLKTPDLQKFLPDDITKDVIKMVGNRFHDHFGDIDPFYLAVTRVDAIEALKHFILSDRLKNFGDYQDAMLIGEDFIYHSYISSYINIGLLDPLEVILEAEKAYKNDEVSINSAEGFIRQILGWREFIRGVYWLKMPEYKDLNFFKANNKLPPFYWSGESKMNCINECYRNTKENSYAHHIQRLMVLGNFALIAGIDPMQVNEWYLIVYSDAYEWVELPNVSGMVLFADGGTFATKPYAASGSYINKMSNYCKNCIYDVKQKHGSKACPFNYLYWNFLIENQHLLKKNHRMALIYKSLEKFDEKKIESIKQDSRDFLKEIYN